MTAEKEPISKSVKFTSKNCPLTLALYKLHSRNRLPVPPLHNLSSSQAASWGSFEVWNDRLCTTTKPNNPRGLPWFWSQRHAMFTYSFYFLQEVLEGKVENKMLTADTKQCLPSTNKSLYVCRYFRYHAVKLPDVTITQFLPWKSYDYSHFFWWEMEKVKIQVMFFKGLH